MSMCPLCNGVSSIQRKCSTCNGLLIDKGRFFDYFDDYSAYLDIDDMKLFDGIEDDHKEHKCPHLFTCGHCDTEKTILIQEI